MTTDMSSWQATIDALTAFYRQILRQPYLKKSVLKIPPPSGWETIDIDALKRQGKTDAVIDLLKHLPYLEGSGSRDELPLVRSYTVPRAYTQSSTCIMDEVNALPDHCVYLTEGVDSHGYSLILDAELGTITAYSVLGYEIAVDQSVYDGLPRSEQWRMHRTLSAAELLNIWSDRYARLVDMLGPSVKRAPETGRFHTRFSLREGDEKAKETGPFEEWRPDIEDAVKDIEDPTMRRWRAANAQHSANVYNSFLRHGWPDTFDKDACKKHLIELELQFAVEEKAFLDANNPDAAVFDD